MHKVNNYSLELVVPTIIKSLIILNSERYLRVLRASVLYFIVKLFYR